MNWRRFLFLVPLISICCAAAAQPAQPLRVFIRAGVKTHGPNQHDHPHFLQDWVPFLRQRGIDAAGSMNFPTPTELDHSDVVVIYVADGMKIVGAERERFENFLRRGGGLVVIHDGVVSADQHEWAKKVQGGAWIWNDPNRPEKKTKWFEGEVGIYFVNTQHPITRGISNFDWKDEIYYDLDMAPDANVLATSFHSVFVIAPQLWTYEKTWAGGSAPYRAFVSIPGHEYDIFNTPHYRAILLRGIAWAGKRSNTDEFCRPEELNSLKYPAGGPTSPAKAAAKLNVHPEFNINLVASEPLVEKVISLDWAPNGKLWVAETPEYPNGRTINRNDSPIYPDRNLHPERYRATKENRPARDRISWLDDTNHDGLMDRKHVFADGLELVTSFVFYKDGVIVAQAPDILWLRDRDRDGKCDMVEGSEKTTLYTGFGTGDAHAVINNFRWGLDGWVYGAIGYSAGHPKSLDGSKDFGRVTAGVIRFKPDGSALEQYASGSCNTWGFDFAPDGEAFYTTATCGEHLLHIVMPEKILARGNTGGLRASWVAPDHQKVFPAIHHTRPAYLQIDWVGGFTASAGSCIYNGGAWPDRFNGSDFSTEPTVHIVHHEILHPAGVTYLASKEPGREETEFVAGADLWFRPIHARVGPDGAVYVLDFYNQAAIHNDTRGPAHGANNAATRPDRDHHFARIWRIQHKEAKTISVPRLDQQADQTGKLIAALAHPNGWVRDTAARLLRENGVGDNAMVPLRALVKADNMGMPAQVAALYTINALGRLDSGSLVEAVNSPSAAVRKNALRIAYERDHASSSAELEAIEKHLNDAEPRARLNALIALGSFDPSPEIAAAISDVWPSLKDHYLESAALGVAAKDPLLFIEAAFKAQEPAFRADFVNHAVRLLANKQDPEDAAKLIELLARQPQSADGLKQIALQSLGTNFKSETAPRWSAQLETAFKSLLHSPRAGLAGATLPLIARWERSGRLSGELQPIIQQLKAKLNDTTVAEEERGQVAANLIGIRALDPSIVPALAALVTSSGSPDFAKRIVTVLGSVPDAAAGRELISAYNRVAPEVREPIFDALFKRAEWSLQLVKAMSDRQIDTLGVGPANLFRLRTHPNREVAAKANEVIDALRGPEQKEKDQLITRFKPEVQKPGNVANGAKVFHDNCATCHAFKDQGRDLAPNLTGMGAHGAGELLVHIIDPNRLVEPNFLSTSIETKDGLIYDGIIARENRAELVLRNAAGDYALRKDNIAQRRSTGRSLMPEGFEALGADGLRDLLGYICADETRFRIVDLRPAFTANTSRGIYNREDSLGETLHFKQVGLVKAGDVPFEIVTPTKSANGRNVVVLKGGSGMAKSYPQRVSVPVGFAASKLHFLGGVGGWAWPCCGENKHENVPVAKATIVYESGAREEIVFRNGVEIADYNGRYDVPGSKELAGVMRSGQLRWFSRPIQRADPIRELTLESFDNAVAPTFVAVTAEIAQPAASASAAVEQKPAGKKRVLIVGGGSSHDFERWFDQADSKTLQAAGYDVEYTSQPSSILERLPKLDVLYLSNNQPLPDPALREAIFQFAHSGKGLLLVHPALWHNWPDWPQYNRELVGGGARSHDRYGEFEVTVDKPNHPLMAGIPATFAIRDELYHFEKDAKGSAIEVLATGRNMSTGKSYPLVWVTQLEGTKIVCITLGHDGQAHDHPAFQTLLKNSVRWLSAGK